MQRRLYKQLLQHERLKQQSKHLAPPTGVRLVPNRKLCTQPQARPLNEHVLRGECASPDGLCIYELSTTE